MKKIILTFLVSALTIIYFSSCRENITSPQEDQVKENSSVIVLKEILEPAERVIWNPGKTYQIKWAVTENINMVRITLVRKFLYVHTIAELTKNDGLFEWQIPDDLPRSNHYRIKIMPENSPDVSVISVEFGILE